MKNRNSVKTKCQEVLSSAAGNVSSLYGCMSSYYNILLLLQCEGIPQNSGDHKNTNNNTYIIYINIIIIVII